MSSYFIAPKTFTKAGSDKPFKHTFFQSERMLVGLNTLAPGQIQHLHEHSDQDKFYFVLDGQGVFSVGEDKQECGAGVLVLAPAGVPHGVENHGEALLSFLTVIAPFPV